MTSKDLASKVMLIDQKLAREGAYAFCIVCGEEWTRKSFEDIDIKSPHKTTDRKILVCPDCRKKISIKEWKTYWWHEL